MKIKHTLLILFIFILSSALSAQAQTSRGGEIITFNTFGEGLMVTRAKMAPISGTVSNIFFYNRIDEPWNGNIWYEYDWEIRGGFPTGGWSQIRVREENGGQLRDAPINVTMTENLGQKFLHYILIRQGNKYVYDVREDFDITTYDYTIATAHEGNSVSILADGARTFTTGGNVAHIPLDRRLDFSLGLTSFDNSFSRRLPGEAYSGDYAVDFARFYGFTGESLDTTPQWQDEFNQNQLDYSKWFPATWTFADTQFTTDNIHFENGHIVFRANRGQDGGEVSSTNLAKTGQASQSTTVLNADASLAIDGVTDGVFANNSVTHTDSNSNSWWELDLAQTSDIDQIVIYNRVDCCAEKLSNFSVSILDESDNVVWTQFYGETPLPTLTIGLTAIGKKVRINLDGELALAEVEVFGTAPEIVTNIALSGTATQSTTAFGGDASRAIDGNTSGIWGQRSITHTNDRTDSWWQVELEEESQIGEIVLFNRTNCCSSRLSNFTVSVLDEDGNIVFSELYEDYPSPSLNINLSVTGKTVKVSLDGILSLAEVQVFNELD